MENLGDVEYAVHGNDGSAENSISVKFREDNITVGLILTLFPGSSHNVLVIPRLLGREIK
jgi:hypothetical protein